MKNFKSFILGLAVMTAILMVAIAAEAQTTISVDPPSITVESTESVIVKTAVEQIKSRTTSVITMVDTEYTVNYIDATYSVVVKYYAGMDNKETTEELFTSTRVADVRTYMKEELQTFFDNL